MLSLELFPPSLASSVTTTVWIGVMVAVFFTLRFGWNLSGLVVPGYMTPLLLVKPLSATVVFAEGVITYLLVHGFSERCSQFGWWSSLFGRDRFFGLVLVSVGVRLLGDGWLWPIFGGLLNDYFQVDFDYRSDLHSFGLIVVALIANQFWKTGVRGGWVPVFTTISLTYLIVRYGLMELTNFSIGNLGYAYDNLAASLLATPKAYIVLLTTAFLASRMNLYYGWEFNGILIPSLLALQWYQPTKILTSFAEAFLILGMARLLFKIPAIAGLHLEGPRELLFFFNLGFFYKLALGWLLPLLWPTAPILDIYGFGYLLTTLIAMRIYDKEIAARLTRATLQTSLVAVGIASLVGFFLMLLPEPSLWPQPATRASFAARPVSQSLSDWLDESRVEIQRSRLQAGAPTPLVSEAAAFEKGLQHLQAYLRGDQAALESANQQFDLAGYRVYRIEQRYLYLREKAPARGWGFYVVDTRAAGNLLVEVPTPLDEQNILIAGSRLFEILGARALAVAGAPRAINSDGSLDVLRNRQTFFHIFHQAMARRDVLQVRGYTARSSETLAGIAADTFRAGTRLPPTTLWVRASLPPSLDLAPLRRLLGDFQVRWASTAPLANLQRDATTAGFAELVLNRSDLRQLLARATVTQGQAGTALQVGDLRIDGYLREWLLADKQRLAERGADLYRTPRLEDLLYFDEEVLTPLLKLLRVHPAGEWSAAELTELRTLATAAHAAGYRLLRYRHRPSGQEHLLLSEDEAVQPRRYWGTYAFRVGEARNYVIAVPRPMFETNTFEYGVSLYEQTKASVLLLAGAHPQANRDGSADVAAAANAASLFTLVNQVTWREAERTPWLTASIRAYGIRPDQPAPSADILLAWDGGTRREDTFSPLGRQLLETLKASAMSVRFVDGAPDTAGYDTGGSPQTRYLNATANKEFCAIWLSPLARSAFNQQNDNIGQEAQFGALGITTRQEDLYQYLASLPPAKGAPLPPAWREAARAYLERRDILSLRQLRDWPGFRYQRVLDHDTQQAFLVVLDHPGRLRLTINLNPRQPDRQITAHAPLEAVQVEQFKNAGAGWLLPDPP
ncbi:MAG: hypothetical protein IPK63_20845 [Candidatus Competibacteraceae bacterium]|nr:hypothetical protein [Candidatus Competibacteraceae bacterium]